MGYSGLVVVAQLKSRLVHCLVGQSDGFFIGWLVGGLVCWLICWLVGSPVNLLD